jgi:hypothetical protein
MVLLLLWNAWLVPSNGVAAVVAERLTYGVVFVDSVVAVVERLADAIVADEKFTMMTNNQAEKARDKRYLFCLITDASKPATSVLYWMLRAVEKVYIGRFQSRAGLPPSVDTYIGNRHLLLRLTIALE